MTSFKVPNFSVFMLGCVDTAIFCLITVSVECGTCSSLCDIVGWKTYSGTCEIIIHSKSFFCFGESREIHFVSNFNEIEINIISA